MFNNHPSLPPSSLITFSKRILQEEQIPVFAPTTSFTLLHRFIRTTLNQRRPNHLNRHQEEDKLPNISSAGRRGGRGMERGREKETGNDSSCACVFGPFFSIFHPQRLPTVARSSTTVCPFGQASMEGGRSRRRSRLFRPSQLPQWFRPARNNTVERVSAHSGTRERIISGWSAAPRSLLAWRRGRPSIQHPRETSRYTVTVLAVVTDRSVCSGSASKLWLRAESMLIPCYRYLDFELVFFFIIFDDTSVKYIGSILASRN